MHKKLFIMIIILASIVMFIPTIVKATNDNPSVSTSVYGTNKSIKVTLKDVSLDDTHQYQFGISKNKATQPEEWNDLFEMEKETATVIITPEKDTMRSILRSVENAYIWIKDTTTNTNVINGIKVSLQLPLTNSLDITFSRRQ